MALDTSVDLYQRDPFESMWDARMESSKRSALNVPMDALYWFVIISSF